MKNIGIVGGSIAGCSAAILLLKAGYEVTVFERSNKPLVGRGGGIGTTPTLLQEIQHDGLIHGEFAKFHIHKMPFVGKSKDHEPFGRTAWDFPVDFVVFQWNELWKNLRRNVPDRCYRAGIKINGAVLCEDDKVELTTADGEREKFDLVLFADGYRSLGRSILFPGKPLKYRGYILWRGLLPEAVMDKACPLNHEILRLSYDRQPGHNVVYFIPNQNGSLKRGERMLNWAAYIAIPDAQLDSYMTDREGKTRKGTVPPGYLHPNIEKKLKQFLSRNIPDYYARMVNLTRESYIQVIYTVDLDTYYKDKMCLIGDAGIVVQPFTGSGVFKGYHNARDLIRCLADHDTVTEALQEWNRNQLNTGKNLLALGEQMEKAFIWEQPDFATVSAEDTRNWWKSSVSFPDDFSYSKD